MDTKVLYIMSKNRELPSTSSSFEILVSGTMVEVITPYIVMGTATMKPAIGPAIPTSNSIFLFERGSLLDIRAPKVPMLNPKIGGTGIKKGREVFMPCILEM